MKPLTTRQAILRQHAARSLVAALWAARCGLAVHRASGWMLDRMEALVNRQRQHAQALADLARRA
jgi:hypothetical protein